MRRSKDAVSVGAEEVLHSVDLAVVAAVRLVELDAAPVAVAEVGAAVVPQHAALDPRDLRQGLYILDWIANNFIRLDRWTGKPEIVVEVIVRRRQTKLKI